MAIKITKTTTIFDEITIPSIYLRFRFNADIFGKKLEIGIEKFSSKETYVKGGYNNSIKINNIPEYLELMYDRATDGADILMFIHNKLKEILTTDITEEIDVTDTSTGEITKQIITVTPKFALPTQIEFIDL